MTCLTVSSFKTKSAVFKAQKNPQYVKKNFYIKEKKEVGTEYLNINTFKELNRKLMKRNS